MIFRGSFVLRLSLALTVWGGMTCGGVIWGATEGAQAQGAFPYGQELRMDADPMKGSKKVPILDIADNGLAEIELWCDAVKARLVVAGDTVTVLTGERAARTCPPERAQADAAMIAALEQATHWRMVGDALVLSGGPAELRFRKQGN
ncbi:META domain-containing protein [Rhodoplanes azumiensis]|uniref:META domain-containing protein n=1 Tax=Rhodoplanes azumiensis TaxID=1897628 RepID=A0ABW5AMM6_9BRAD